MDNFWEKLKDILYDSTDYIIMLITILVVVLIINWRIGGLFSKNKLENDKKDNIGTIADDSQTEDNYESDKVEDDEDTPEDTSDELIQVKIPDGLLPLKVGEVLEEHGIIEDKNEFVQKTIEMEKDTKLKSGNFEIPKNSSLEEVINIISR